MVWMDKTPHIPYADKIIRVFLNIIADNKLIQSLTSLGGLLYPSSSVCRVRY